MTIVIAPDKFKGSLTARQVCDAVKEGLLSINSSHNIISLPLADGGEGTSDLLTALAAGSLVKVKVMDPLLREIDSEYGLSLDGKTAFIEMAKASGLLLLAPRERNPLHTSSYGTGQLIADALARGATQIILCIGGSATNDAGIGMAEALGFEFYNMEGERLKPKGENLTHLQSINTKHSNPRIKNAEFFALCDVNNPLFGAYGAAFVYGPQKGANEEAVKSLDTGLQNFENVIQRTFHTSANFPGAGAGGGLPGGGKAFLGLTIQHGMDYVAQASGLEAKIQQAGFIITGEGKIDSQTLAGKVVMEVAKLGMKYNKPVVAICGQCDLAEDDISKLGISKVITLVDELTPIDKAMKHAALLIRQRISEILPFWC